MNISLVIKEFKNNKHKLLNYLQKLYLIYNNINYELNDILYPKSYLYTFIPLPNSFILNELYDGDDKIIQKENNIYMFLGKSGLRLLFSNMILPFNTESIKYPIPFSFPIIKNNKLEIYQSNIYYYEITILLEKNNNIDNNNNNISIGFGNQNISFKNHVGWESYTIGLHSNDGSIYINSYQKSYTKLTETWKPGDTIGAGIIYINENLIKPFFTFNGQLVYLYHSTLNILIPYSPTIGYNHNHSIKVNFSNYDFKYDIVPLINNYNFVLSTNNTFIYNYIDEQLN